MVEVVTSVKRAGDWNERAQPMASLAAPKDLWSMEISLVFLL